MNKGYLLALAALSLGAMETPDMYRNGANDRRLPDLNIPGEVIPHSGKRKYGKPASCRKPKKHRKSNGNIYTRKKK